MLYRAALSSLSVARAISLDRALLEYLDALCLRAYFVVYGSAQRPGRAFARFFTRRFPAAVRRHVRPILMALLFLLLGTIVAYAMTARDADWFYVFVGEDMAAGRNPAATTAELREALYDDGEALTAFAGFLFQHNAAVGILAFALGFLAGVPVFLLLFYTGLMLGAFSALYASRDLSLDWWGWVMPHGGVTELGAVVLCGGAGLVVARSLVFPGREARLANLARAGRDAGIIVLGCVVMFFLAGLIEGYFRQLVKDIQVRYAVIAVSTLAWALYFWRAGR